MDADFSHHPKHLPTLLAGMEPGDGEARRRRNRRRDDRLPLRTRGGVEGWPPHRHLMSRGVNLYARCLLGLKSKDCSGAYRCYRTELLAKLDFDAIRSRGYSFQEEILWHLKRAGARFGEAPIVFADRQRGASKIDSGEAFSALWIIFLLGFGICSPVVSREGVPLKGAVAFRTQRVRDPTRWKIMKSQP